MNIEIKSYLKQSYLLDPIKENEARKEVDKITNAIHFVGTFTVEFL